MRFFDGKSTILRIFMLRLKTRYFEMKFLSKKFTERELFSVFAAR